MPIKFIDSEIWRKERFRKLTPVQKCFVFYILTTCNHAGICEVDIEAASFIIGEKIENPEEFLIGEFKIIELEDSRKWFMPLYLKLNYKSGMNSQKPAVLSAIKILEEYEMREAVSDLFGSKFLTDRDYC